MTKVQMAYYNFMKLMSFNAILMFLIGGRGLGKSYGAKKLCIKAAITKGEEFIYLRRYREELTAAKESFFADILGEFPDYDFRTHGKYAQYSHIKFRDDKRREWHTIGYFIALSTAQNQKSQSFPKVYKIIFDEFIIEKGLIQYLPNEVVAFINFYSTVDRDNDRVRVFFLANSVSIENPYFIHYKIAPQEGEEWIRKFKGYLIVHFPNSQDFKDAKNRTRFGQFILESDPEYQEYATGNQFADNNKNLLKYKNQEARYQYSLETATGKFSIWMDWENREWFIQERLPQQELVFTICPEKMRDGVKLLFKNDRQMQILRSAFKSGRVLFDQPRTRNAFVEIFSTR